ncbi:MAG: MFS transporter [Planctomycetota bacterium]|nr:MFS transporter [Planctomycetota bacterium]
MTDGTATTSAQSTEGNQLLFWGCFIALITTAFGFISRMFLINTWGTEFGLDQAEAGRLAGIGIWPFAVSIIGFSLFIDRIGYKVAMIFAFASHIIWAVMGVIAFRISRGGDPQTAYQLIYWGSLIVALGNGTVEAFINPVVATIFNRDKTKWLNILHAGWPGGLVIAGVIVIFMGQSDWDLKVGIIAVPAVIYLLMLLPCKFPTNERVATGVSYRDMLSEFGLLGALIVGVLVSLQLMGFFEGTEAFCDEVDGKLVLAAWAKGLFWAIGAAIAVGFGIYTRSLGRPLMFVLVLIMMPLATTEIGTDGWITGIMQGVFELNEAEVAKAGGAENVTTIEGKFYSLDPGWVLVYTSLIMMILRFFAGSIIHRLSPLGLLAISCVLAIVGLYSLSMATGTVIFVAATLYALGKTFFWPTMLGVVSEQTPKGGAVTLNAISGIGMLAVGTLGFPFIGALQVDKENAALVANEEVKTTVRGLVSDGKLTVLEPRQVYEVIHYDSISESQLKAVVEKLPEGQQKEANATIAAVRSKSSQGALADMAFFPLIMLVCYLLLILYFKSKGGYEPVAISSSDS